MEFSGDHKGFRTPCDKTIPLTRKLRAPGEVDGESRGLDHDVSSMTGEELTPGRLATGIMWPRWQTGQPDDALPAGRGRPDGL